MSKPDPQTTTDAEYLRSMKTMKHSGVPELEKHNERLERIAKRLEYLEKQDEHAN